MEPYKTIREQAFECNRQIPELGMAIYTFGNVSAYDPDLGVLAIKPSGVAYSELTPESMVVVDLDHKVVSGELRPSSDTNTHIVLYRSFKGINGVVHTHLCRCLGPSHAADPHLRHNPCRSCGRGDSLHRCNER
jgi:L-ribulose-5-phosphate 4-epimerase